jgi:rare lipoprotein A
VQIIDIIFKCDEKMKNKYILLPLAFVLLFAVSCTNSIRFSTSTKLKSFQSKVTEKVTVSENDLVGKASFYGDDFNGKRTASGEIFNMNELTAAHRSLPFGTIVKVTNLKNGATAKVIINDRGPYVADRIIDLSQAAAEELDMLNDGIADVKLEIQK